MRGDKPNKHTSTYIHTYKYYPITPSPLYRESVEHKRIFLFWFSNFHFLCFIRLEKEQQSKLLSLVFFFSFCLLFRSWSSCHQLILLCICFVHFTLICSVYKSILHFYFLWFWNFHHPPPYHTVSLYCPFWKKKTR